MKYPSFFRLVVFAKNIDNTKLAIPELQSLLNIQFDIIRKDNGAQLEHFRVRKWNDVYRECGINTYQNKSSIYTLLSRIQKGKEIPFISPLVSIMNLVSMTYLLPCGGIDASTIQGDLELSLSKGNETFMPFGKNETELLPPMEVIYYDTGSRNVICRSWNSKGGQLTKILNQTNFAIIDLDSFEETASRKIVFESADYMTNLIEKYCNGTCTVDILSREQPELLVPNL